MIEFKVNDTAVQESLARLKANTGNLRPAMQDVGIELSERIRGQFSQGQSPYGESWEPLSEATKLARARKAAGRNSTKKDGTFRKGAGERFVRAYSTAKPLLDTNRLRGSITSNPRKSFVTVGTSNVVYAATHQFGRGNIPARPYMPIRGSAAELPAPWMAAVVGIIEDHILGGA